MKKHASGALGVLQVLIEAERPLESAEIQRRLDRGQSAVWRSLKQLERIGFARSPYRGVWETALTHKKEKRKMTVIYRDTTGTEVKGVTEWPVEDLIQKTAQGRYLVLVGLVDGIPAKAAEFDSEEEARAWLARETALPPSPEEYLRQLDDEFGR